MGISIIICTGGSLGAWALQHIEDGDYLIGADSGALFLVDNGIAPHVAIGDFDSVTAEEQERIAANCGEFITCDPVDKNYTDTEMAFRLALSKKPARIKLLGALGTRFDHALANVHLLALAEAEGIEACILDKHNAIALATSSLDVHQLGYSQVSLLPLTESVTGITLTGFQYPLQDATLTIGQSLGISNVLAAQTGQVTLASGKLLVIQSRD
ncbi:thiamine diphosphokinase [Paenibacillus sp. CAU 1782]